MKKRKPRKVLMEAKCIFGHSFTMDAAQITAARELGIAMCPKCGNPATISKVRA